MRVNVNASLWDSFCAEKHVKYFGALIFRDTLIRSEPVIFHVACESTEPKAKYFACGYSDENICWGSAPPHLASLYIKKKAL